MATIGSEKEGWRRQAERRVACSGGRRYARAQRQPAEQKLRAAAAGDAQHRPAEQKLRAAGRREETHEIEEKKKKRKKEKIRKGDLTA